MATWQNLPVFNKSYLYNIKGEQKLIAEYMSV